MKIVIDTDDLKHKLKNIFSRPKSHIKSLEERIDELENKLAVKTPPTTITTRKYAKKNRNIKWSSEEDQELKDNAKLYVLKGKKLYKIAKILRNKGLLKGRTEKAVQLRILRFFGKPLKENPNYLNNITWSKEEITRLKLITDTGKQVSEVGLKKHRKDFQNRSVHALYMKARNMGFLKRKGE